MVAKGDGVRIVHKAPVGILKLGDFIKDVWHEAADRTVKHHDNDIFAGPAQSKRRKLIRKL